MGKKPTWFSAIKSLCTSNSKQPLNEDEKKTYNKRRGKFKHGSSIPFFRKPSSIEEILGEVDQHNLFIQHHPTAQSQPQPPQQQPQSQSQPQPPPPQQQQQQQQPQSPPQPQQQQPQPKPQPQPPQPQAHQQQQQQPQPASSSSGRPASPPPHRFTSPKVEPKISHTPEPTLQQRHLSAIRIQAVYRGYMARKKVGSLTGLVRLQSYVTSQNVKRQTVNAMKQMQLLVKVQTQIQSQRVQMLEKQALKSQPKSNKPHKQADEDWDDSLITKEEREARLKRKEEALIKRERAMAYAYSHQLPKGTPTSAHLIGGYPWWWKWLEHQLPYHTTPTLKKHQYAPTPTRSTPPTTPMSSKSTKPYSKARKGASPYPMKDDDSLMSCPQFSVPNYMSPTASARAKARPTSNPKERGVTPTTPRSETSNRRFSYPFNNRHKSPGSIGELSMDSMPSSVGRKPFNRFV